MKEVASHHSPTPESPVILTSQHLVFGSNAEDNNDEEKMEESEVSDDELDDENETRDEEQPASADDEIQLDESLVKGVLNKRCLERFALVTSIRICSDKKQKNWYTICLNCPGQPDMLARVRVTSAGKKDGSCCSGSSEVETNKNFHRQPFTIDINNAPGNSKIMRLLCTPDGRVVVEAPVREVVAYISAERILCSLQFTVKDIYGHPRLLVKGPRYCLPEDCDACNGIYQILLPDESTGVGELNRVSEHGEVGLNLEIPQKLNTELKVALIGVTLLFNRRLFA